MDGKKHDEGNGITLSLCPVQTKSMSLKGKWYWSRKKFTDSIITAGRFNDGRENQTVRKIPSVLKHTF